MHPKCVDTPMINNETIGRLFEKFSETAATCSNHVAVDPIEPAAGSNAIAWLVSDDARYITGVALPMDAGYSSR